MDIGSVGLLIDVGLVVIVLLVKVLTSRYLQLRAEAICWQERKNRLHLATGFELL